MNWSYWFGRLLFRSAFRSLFGLRIVGRGKLLLDEPVLIAANHESFLDPLLIGAVYPKGIWFVARKTLFRGIAGPVIRSWNAIPVDQERADVSSLKAIVRCVRGGNSILVFPEGQRTFDGTLGAAQPGIGLIIAKTGAAVQPIRIRDARKALPRGSKRVRFTPISVTIGDPIRFDAAELKAARSREAHQKIAERIMTAIGEL